jgi:hypothetical protein
MHMMTGKFKQSTLDYISDATRMHLHSSWLLIIQNLQGMPQLFAFDEAHNLIMQGGNSIMCTIEIAILHGSPI